MLFGTIVNRKGEVKPKLKEDEDGQIEEQKES